MRNILELRLSSPSCGGAVALEGLLTHNSEGLLCNLAKVLAVTNVDQEDVLGRYHASTEL